MGKQSQKSLADQLKPFVAPFRYDGSGEFHLKSHKTGEKGGLDKEKGEKIIEANRKRLSDFQEKLYAQDRWSLLLIFQGMDAAGKDSAIKSVFDGVDPQGCEVTAFKVPTSKELDHDFLWRAGVALPERGRIGIFNRSYYEEVLVVRVHPSILESEGVPNGHGDAESIWRRRYDSIVDMERHLHRNGTRIVKFFLHLSRDEQRKRFLDRIDEPSKNWKFNEGDIEERKYWDEYMRAYEKCLSATSAEKSPWYIVPADGKKNARLIISEIVVETLKSLKMAYPETTPERRAELEGFRKLLEH